MKKIFVLFLTLVTINALKSQVRFGIKAGLNITDLNVSGQNVTSGIKSRGDFNAGVLVNVPISNSFAIQPELVYSGQGGSLKDSSGSLKYNYINLPVLVQFRFASGFFIESGPQLGFLISSNYDTENTHLDVKSQSKSTDFGWAFGIGYKIPSVDLGIDIRYNLGITNTSTIPPFVIKNSVFQFGVFFLF